MCSLVGDNIHAFSSLYKVFDEHFVSPGSDKARSAVPSALQLVLLERHNWVGFGVCTAHTFFSNVWKSIFSRVSTTAAEAVGSSCTRRRKMVILQPR